MELAAEREEVAALRERITKLIERRACELVRIQRSSFRYQAKRSAVNQGLQERLRELSLEQPRYGYPRLGVLVRREYSEAINEKRIRRLCREAGLALRKLRRKKCKREAVPQIRLQKENQEWAMDFVEDSAANGQKLRFLAVIDQFTRECVCLCVISPFRSLFSAESDQFSYDSDQVRWTPLIGQQKQIPYVEPKLL